MTAYLEPEGFGRTRFAWWTIPLDNQSTRSSISRRTSYSTSGACLLIAEFVTNLASLYAVMPPGCQQLKFFRPVCSGRALPLCPPR